MQDILNQPMSAPERIVVGWLIKRNINFSFQSSLMGGWFELGGAIVDVLLDELRIALRVQGVYFHQGIAKKGTDDIQREMLEAEGWQVIDVWENTLETSDKVEETMRLAIQGIEVLR